MALIHHFQYIFPELTQHKATAAPVLTLGLQKYPFLLDAALAVAASHSRHQVIQKERYKIAECQQQLQTIPGFNEAMKQSLNQELADALVLTSVFLGMLTFSCVDVAADVRDSWLFSNDPQALGWFSLNLGLKVLIERTASYQTNSILDWMYTGSDNDAGTFYGNHSTAVNSNIPQHWREFLRLHSPEAMEVFGEPARFLAEIKELQPTPQFAPMYANFVGALDVEFRFRSLLLQRDERAIWLLGYWMGLLCRLDCWWMRGRAQLEWQATCMWMEERVWKFDCDFKSRELHRKIRDELHQANTYKDRVELIN